MNDIRKSKLYDLMEAKIDCNIEFYYDENGNITGKKFIYIPPWKHLKTNKTTHNSDNIIIRSGQVNNISVLDLDIEDDEIPGLEFFEKHICPLSELNTLITKTPNGGYHLYFKYNKKLKTGVKLKYFGDTISIDPRNDGAVLGEGKHYPLFKDADELAEIPEKFFELTKKEEELKKFENENKNDLYTDDGIDLILSNLAPEYYTDYDKWLLILITLKNVGYDIQMAKNFSMKSEKYDERELEQKWRTLQQWDTPTIGTLLFCLKQSTSASRYKYLRNQLKSKLKNSDDGIEINDMIAYNLFCEKYGNRIKTLIDGSVYICDLNNNIWYQTKKNDKTLRLILKEFDEYLHENNYKYDLHKKGQRDNFIEEVLIHLQEKSVKFNDDIHLLPFDNGVLDIRTGELKNAEPADNIYMTTGYEFIQSEDEGQMAFDFLSKMFKDEEELKCVINVLSLCLEGKNRNEYIYMLIGESACNGKSTLMEIIKNVLGKFAYRFPTNLICGSRENSESGNPAIKNFKYKRFAYCSEPDAKAKMNINTIKELTGDIISVRGLYSNEQDEFRCQSNMFVLCQSPPNLDKVDEGIKRRIITIPFNISFVDNPTNEFQEKKIDYSSEDKEKFKSSFLYLLCSAYKYLHETDYKFDIPESFKQYKNEYIEECNMADNAILENFEYCEGKKIKSSEIIEFLKEHSLTPREIKSKFKKLLNVEVIKKREGNFYMNVDYKNDYYV